MREDYHTRTLMANRNDSSTKEPTLSISVQLTTTTIQNPNASSYSTFLRLGTEAFGPSVSI